MPALELERPAHRRSDLVLGHLRERPQHVRDAARILNRIPLDDELEHLRPAAHHAIGLAALVLAHPVLEEEWSKALLIVGRAAVDELVEAVAVIDSVTRRGGAVVETAREVVSQIVKPLAADIRSQLEKVFAEERGEVVNELVVGLISLNRKIAGTADGRLGRNRAGVE